VNRSFESRENCIRALMPAVKRIARRIKRLVPGFDLDDLIGDGSIGLIRAVDSYDPSRGPTLEQYARRLIAGAMLNGIRSMDPVSERSRRIVRDGESARYALAATRGEVPSSGEMEALHPGFNRAVTAAHRGQPLSLDAPLPDGEHLSGDWNADPAIICQRRSDRAELMASIDGLPQRQRDLLLEHYFGERSLRSIGRRLAISAQRASQLHVAAIAALKGSVRAAAD
jgi:RNA polymerase sigma factor for flagellar operon FliA